MINTPSVGGADSRQQNLPHQFGHSDRREIRHGDAGQFPHGKIPRRELISREEVVNKVAGPDDGAGEIAGMGNGAGRGRRSRATQRLVMADYISNPLLALIKEQGSDRRLAARRGDAGAEPQRENHCADSCTTSASSNSKRSCRSSRSIWARKWSISPTRNYRLKSLSLIPASTARMYQCVPIADYRFDPASRVGRSAESGDYR